MTRNEKMLIRTARKLMKVVASSFDFGVEASDEELLAWANMFKMSTGSVARRAFIEARKAIALAEAQERDNNPLLMPPGSWRKNHQARVQWMADHHELWDRPKLEIVKAMKDAGVIAHSTHALDVRVDKLIEEAKARTA